MKHRLQLELPDKPRVSSSSVAAMLDGQLITLENWRMRPSKEIIQLSNKRGGAMPPGLLKVSIEV